jgi:translation elongation factor EF-Tu-like GTPase
MPINIAARHFLEKLFFQATLTILTKSVGGRSTPLFTNGGHYRPHAIVRDDPEMLGIAFMAGPDQLVPGETADIQLQAMYHPQVNYDKLQAGVQFLVVEGLRIVAVGKVLRRWVEAG